MLIFLVVVPFVIPSVYAFTLKAAEDTVIPRNETIEGNVVAFGNSVTVDGKITGDLICAVSSLVVTGTIDGDILCAGKNVTIAGLTNGNLRLAGNHVELAGATEKNGTVLAQYLFTKPSFHLGRELFFAGNKADLSGSVGTDLSGVASTIVLHSSVGGNATLRASQLSVLDGAAIGKNLIYTSENSAVISSASAISGETVHQIPEKSIHASQRENNAFLNSLMSAFIIILAYMFIGLLLTHFFPRQVENGTYAMERQPFRSLGWGVVLLGGTPFVVFLLLLTVIGIIPAIILFLFYIIALLLSQVFTSLTVGQKLLDRLWTEKKFDSRWQVIIGVIVTILIYSIPIIGWLLSIFGFFWGLGGIWYAVRKR